MGLVVKEGTWVPKRVIEEQQEGVLCSEEKFLGALLMVVKGRDALEAVPYMEEKDLVKLIGNMRQQEVVMASKMERRLFDTARGYMITGAYHHPALWNAMAAIVRDCPSEIVVQRVQADDGRGERPEHHMICGEDFRWPTSDGFPEINFCKNVFLSDDNTIEGNWWRHIFPDLKSQLKAFRSKAEYVQPLKERKTEDWNMMEQRERYEETLEDKREPRMEVENIEVLTRAKWKPPRDFVKFRLKSAEDSQRKEQRLDDLLENYDEIHHEGLSLFLPYGGYWITREMLKKSGVWYYTASGFWTRDATRQARNITSVWGREEKRALGERVHEETPTASSLSTQPDVADLQVVVQDFWAAIPKLVLPDESMDDVSFVSASFVTAGSVLDTTTQVLSQAPARVKAVVTVRGANVCLGWSVSTSAKEAKRSLMKEVRRKLKAGRPEPEGAGRPPTPAPRHVDTDAEGARGPPIPAPRHRMETD
nr:MAG: RNA-dependent RNA polymerase [Skomarfal virus 32]